MDKESVVSMVERYTQAIIKEFSPFAVILFGSQEKLHFVQRFGTKREQMQRLLRKLTEFPKKSNLFDLFSTH